MAKLTCPYCNEIGISAFRKSWLGPAIPIKCRKCGKKIGVPYGKALIACTPILIPFILYPILEFNIIYFALPIALVISLILYLQWVPIVEKDSR